MRTRDIALSLALALGTTLGLLTLLHSPGQDGEIPAAHAAPLHAPHTAPGETFCVSHGGAAPPGCDSAFTQIQAAVDAASGGELIKVAGGVYDDIQTRGAISQVVYITKSVTIRGGYTTTDNFADPPDPTAYFTTIDGQGIGRGMYITGPITVTLEGLRVTNGWSDDKGGGFFVANARVTISRCQIFSNSVGNEGAGLFLLDADHATILQSDIFSNTADSHAGGILLESSDHVHLTQNNIYRNRASFWNGGVCIKIGSHITLDENTIHGNVAANGAGVLVEHAEDIALSDNDIFDNWARGGGGLYVQNSSRITLERTRVYSNTATSGDGGGMYLNQCSPVTFTNTLLADNRIDAASGEGAGAHIARSSTRFIHTTIARNTGGGGEGLYLRGGSTAWLTNTILVGHTVGAFLDWSTLTATHTLWGAGAWDNVTDVVEFDDSLANTSADIHGDPVFADPGAADYHILPPSAAWNAALDTGLSDDIDRDTRPRYSGVDIGADEYAGSCLVRLNDGTIFGTVQAAVDASTQSTDVVKVRGRCNTVHGRDGLNQVVYLNKTLTLQGGWDADFTAQDPEAYPATLDARRQGRVIFITDGVTPTIEDLTLTGGNASHETPYPGFGLGGGICVADADPIIRSNVITNNVSYTGTEPGTGGGGIFIRGASATSVISGNAILSNTARAEGTGSGGGIYLFRSTARVAENQIRHNTACYGGGVTAYDSDGLTLQGNTIISNTAIEDEYGLATGGGLAMEFTGPFTMTNNVIAQNDVSVSGTQAFARGGGFYLYGSPSSPNPDDYAFGWLANNTIAENTSGTGDGLYLLGSTVTLLNNIVVSHTEGIRAASSNSGADVRYTLFYGNGQDTTGFGTITNTHPIAGQSPLFVDPTAFDYHIWPHSPAVDAGDPTGAPPAPSVDIDGEPRPMGGGVDIGADEVGCTVQLNDGPTYPTVEAAVRAVTQPSDVVRVSGMCLAHDVELTQTLTLEGGWSRDFNRHDPQARATLNAQGLGRVIEIRGGAPTVAYLNLVNGQTDADGAGVYAHSGATSPTLYRNEIYSNTADDDGAGVYISAAEATLDGNAIHHNATSSYGAGGGVYYSGQVLLLRNSHIYSNTSGIGGGGGVYCDSDDATLTGNEITANRTTNTGDGGGVEIGGFAGATLEGNTIRANTAHRNGGGVFVDYQSDITLTNNVVADNVCCQAQYSVGGAGVWLGTGDHILRHNTLANNEGGDGAGIRLGGDAVLTNTIVVSHSVGITLASTGSSAVLEGTLWHGNGQDYGGPGTLVTGTIDLHQPPAFADAAHGDYHLQAGSPAVDAGVALPAVRLDRDGNPRPDCAAWDIGAYEVQGLLCWRIYLPLTLRAGS